MWKVSQIYLSDFRAGNNYMDDGLIKVLDDNGEARDCLIFSPNGTFKTSLLSIALSQLSPSKDRFIQTLQSSSKAIENYVIRQRPALVMTKFVAQTEQPSLLDDGYGESVVIGQLFFLRPPNSSHQQDVLERLFFISDDGNVLEQIRQCFLALRSDKDGWNQLKKQIATLATVEETQKNWLNLLNDAGLDPFLVDKQVEMCKEEGGITKTLTFKDENAFMSAFLNMTMDTEHSQNLHINVLKGMDKHRNVPRRKAELTAAVRLQEVLTEFEKIAGNWRQLEVEKKDLNLQMSEASYLLHAAYPSAERALEKATQEAKAVDQQLHAVIAHEHISIADNALIKQEELRRDCEALKQEQEQNQARCQQADQDLIALNAGGLLSSLDEKQQAFDSVNVAFQAASTELAPIKLHLEEMKATFHARLAFEKKALENKKRDNTELLSVTEKEQAKEEGKLHKVNVQITDLKRQDARYSTQIENAEKACNSLSLVSEESPQEGKERLEESLQQQKEHIAALITSRQKEKSRQSDLQDLIVSTKAECADYQRAADEIDQWLKEEQAAREEVLVNTQLTVIAGAVDFNPYCQSLASAISEAISRQDIYCDKARSDIAKLTNQLGQLEELNTLSEDPLTGELVAHYINEGIPSAKLRSFSEYLDNYFGGDTDEIAALMRSDPARFGGLMAVDQETLDQVAQIEAPEWLVRPIIVSLGDDLDVNIPFQSHVVVEPKDFTVYSHRALEQKKAALSRQLDDAHDHANAMKKKNEELCFAQTLCVQLLKHFISHEHIALKRQERKNNLQQVAIKEKDLKDFTQELAVKAKAIEDNEAKERELIGLVNKTNITISHIESWLKLYAELSEWKKALSQVSTDLVMKEQEEKALKNTLNKLSKTIRDISNDIERCMSQLASLQDNHSVPLPFEDTPFPEVSSSSLQVLQQTYYDADRALTQASTENGIGALEAQRYAKERDVNVAKNVWRNYQEQHTTDMSLAKHWQSVAHFERVKTQANLETALIDLKANKDVILDKLERNQQIFQESTTKLNNHCKKHKVMPSLVANDILHENLEVLMLQARQQHEHAKSETQRLATRAKEQHKDMINIKEWQSQLNLSSARIGEQTPEAPLGESLIDWPSLTIGSLPDRYQASKHFDEIVKDIDTKCRLAEKRYEKERRQLNAGFDLIKRQIEKKDIANVLFDLVQRLLNTDAATFAYQTADFIGNCENVVRNLKIDIEAIDSHVSGLVNSLLDHASECYRTLNAACDAEVPRSVLVYGGYSILNLTSRLDFNKHRDLYKEAMKHWFFDAVEKQTLPQANTKKGDELGTSLLYRLLRCSGSRKRTVFGIGLLKLAGRAGEYVPISEDLSSGGERLTSATMLYSVISHVRSRQRQHIAKGNSVRFLFMDNPLSKASKASFVQAQLHTCKAFDIQPIFVTGVGDIAALEQFSNRIVITQADGRDGVSKHLNINGEKFSRIVISEELLTQAMV
ncbi:hypothetical protein [Photobacterium phosphoreum]|uniref:hypothetical protein n=1 Tax=Photobacterium phosphoreum TaxID=659 RepID=UPI001E2AB74E|nr:hypothetical protein [Photobacterium phosphoreum]MCD9508986.1 hypothetical protein [Photobacterium phosphoreum]